MESTYPGELFNFWDWPFIQFIFEFQSGCSNVWSSISSEVQWQAIELVSVRSIRTNFFKMLRPLYKTLRNCVDTIMSDEHVPSEALIDMLLSFVSSARNLINLGELKPLRPLVMVFLLAGHNWENSLCNLPLGKVEVEFQHLKDESYGTTQSL